MTAPCCPGACASTRRRGAPAALHASGRRTLAVTAPCAGGPDGGERAQRATRGCGAPTRPRAGRTTSTTTHSESAGSSGSVRRCSHRSTTREATTPRRCAQCTAARRPRCSGPAVSSAGPRAPRRPAAASAASAPTSSPEAWPVEHAVSSLEDEVESAPATAERHQCHTRLDWRHRRRRQRRPRLIAGVGARRAARRERRALVPRRVGQRAHAERALLARTVHGHAGGAPRATRKFEMKRLYDRSASGT